MYNSDIVDGAVLQNSSDMVVEYSSWCFLVRILIFSIFSISLPLIFSWIDGLFDKTGKSGKNKKDNNDSHDGLSIYSIYNEDDYNLPLPRGSCGKEGEKTDTLNYYDLLQHPKWKEKRLKILQRDNFQCVVCGYGKKLQIHHKRYKTDPKTGQRLSPWEYDDDDLVTLCDLHHKRIHGR